MLASDVKWTSQLTHGDDVIMANGQSLINTLNLHDQMLPCRHTAVARENLKLSEWSHTTLYRHNIPQNLQKLVVI